MRTLHLAIVLLLAGTGSAFAWWVDVRAQGLVSEDAADGVAVLPGGDAIVVGDLDCDPTALRIDRDTGDVVWRTEIATFGSGCPTATRNVTGVPARLAVAGDDTVVVAPGGLVVKLDTATGAERWRHQVEGYGYGVWLNGLVIDPAGGVMVAGSIAGSDSHPESDFLVAALDGATGVERWRQVRNGTPGPPDPDDVDPNDTEDVATAIALDAAGNALVAGSIEHRGVPKR
jgi:outer membrane protein assembly factor BamB